MTIDILQAFEKEPPNLDFIWPGFLTGTVGALVAPGATGKSFWAFEAAMSVACNVPGGDILGLNPHQTGRVLYIAGEDPESALIRRLHSIGKHLNSSARKTISKNLEIMPIMGSRFDIMNSQQLEDIVCLSTGTRLVILDTLSRIHHLEENSNGDMARLVGQLEYVASKSGTSVLYLHHVNKSSAWSGTTDQQQAARGASVLIDNARWGAFMSTMTKEQAERYSEGSGGQIIGHDKCNFYVRFGVSKQNHNMITMNQWYKRHDGGVLLPVKLQEVKEDEDKGLGGKRYTNGF